MNNKPAKTILISGAGVGGLTLAYWLQTYGYEVTIVERAPSLRDGGYAVDLRGPAVSIVQKMAILPQIRELAISNHGTYVNEKGKVLCEPGNVMELFAGDGETADAELMRGDLLQLLYKKISPSVTFIWNDSIQSLQQNESGVQVTFVQGSARTFDVVVGADGMHSGVRKLAWNNEQEHIQHLGYYVSLFTIPNYLSLKNKELICRTPGKLAGIYATRNPQDAKAIFYFTSPLLTYDFRDMAAQKAIVARQFAGQGWEVPKLLELMETAPDFYFDTIAQITLDTWHMGRVALVGDAAYCPSPLSGQGTSLAMVGAYVLAGELKAAAGDYQLAFAAYEKEMRCFVNVNQKSAAASGKQFVPSSKFGQWFSDLNIKLLPHMPWRMAIVKMFREPFDAITLKQY